MHLKVKILIIGSEVLNGFIKDTNSNNLSQKLFKHGIKVDEVYTIRDHYPTIVSTIKNLIKEPCLLITSGGLGPTDDDLTIDALCEISNCEEVFDPEAKRRTELFFKNSQNKTKINLDTILRQTRIPKIAHALPNNAGLAPGCWIPKLRILSLPGFPREIESIWPYAEKHILKLDIIRKKTITLPIWGIGESEIFSKIPKIKNINIGVHALPFGSKLFFEGDEKTITQLEKDIRNLYSDNIVSDPLKEFINWCIKNNKTLSTAESCTGGFGAESITAIPGVSKIYNGSIVAYSNSVKEEILNIPNKILLEHGAVSLETSRAMALNTQKLFKTDFAISTTGIAGPSGGSKIKPVGTVFISVASPDNCWTGKFFLPFQRDRFRKAVISIAFLFAFRNFTKNSNLKSYPFSNFKICN